METIAQEAKRLLEPIPEDQWTTKDFTDRKSKCCAFGHYSRLNSSDDNNFSIANCSEYRGRLGELQHSIYVFTKGEYSLIGVNDGASPYPQPTPKQRVLALLNDMIKAGY
ncbi:hypothetical protein MUK70_11635 [Dyadobacter chenwenxiniae]|uniref:Uncharacterized protein n=1 Tax=Dyadobacter chenwenxiniae TaxID=2906456 RepID=A0A9X1TBK4_9BACT|nr:hypothetical protein [Dyadobacter chenwenxiniae]MCF0059891.1 hypothetical protein [Dyadobacter chenwenxiniae]UON85631.1 hypothetical protein MUK70_11635 [Dyadobacter chenwenxiniae]